MALNYDLLEKKNSISFFEEKIQFVKYLSIVCYDYIFLIRIDFQINGLELKKIHLNNLDNNILIEGIDRSMVVAQEILLKFIPLF